jgi:hypothetical protein
MAPLGMTFDPSAIVLGNLGVALQLARAGVRVFPCDARPKPSDPNSPTKRPLIEWTKDATTDEDRLAAWWERWPNALVGMPAGPAGLVIIDADRHGGPDGVAAFEELAARHGLPPGPIVETLSGGRHYYFRQPAGEPLGNGKGSLPAGVDVRGAGGFVASAGSEWRGRSYSGLQDVLEAFEEGNFPVLPDWLADMLRAKPETSTVERPLSFKDRVELRKSNHEPDDFFTAVKRLALQNLGAWVPAIFPRARPQSGTGAYRIRSKALGRNLEEDLSIAPNGIVDFGVHDMGDPREGKRTAIDIVMEYGGEPDALAAAKWLCERMGVDPEALGALPERAEWDGIVRDPQPRDTIVEDGVEADAETGEVIEPPKPRAGASGPRFKLTRFDEIPYSIDDDDLVEGILPSTGVAVIWGAPKSGKSFWALDLSMHIALGWKYRDRNVESGVVVYVALEGQTGFRRRVEGFCREKLGGKRDHDALFYLIETPLKLVKDHTRLVNDIRVQLGDLRPSAIFFDTFFRAFEGSEIDASDMEKNLAACDAIKLAFGCLVALIHHSGWDGERMRGHSSLFGGVDAVVSVKKDGQNVVAKLEDAKDIASGAEIASRLIEVEIGTNKYGNPVTTLAIADAAEPVEIKIDEEAQEMELASEQRLLRAMLNKPHGATREWAEMADISKGGVDRALERLRKLKLVEKPFAKWRLTKAGEREAKLLDGVENG